MEKTRICYIFLHLALCNTFVEGTCPENVTALSSMPLRQVNRFWGGQGSLSISDDNLNYEWYRVVHNGWQFIMVDSTNKPNYTSCSTYFPVYLKDTHPLIDTLTETPVDVVACKRDYLFPCDIQHQVKIRKCGDEIQYYLPPTKSYSAFCFSNHSRLSSAPNTSSTVDVRPVSTTKPQNTVTVVTNTTTEHESTTQSSTDVNNTLSYGDTSSLKYPWTTTSLENTTQSSVKDTLSYGDTSSQKYPSTETALESATQSSAGVKFPQTYGDTSSQKYPSTETALESATQSSAGVKFPPTYGDTSSPKYSSAKSELERTTNSFVGVMSTPTNRDLSSLTYPITTTTSERTPRSSTWVKDMSTNRDTSSTTTPQEQSDDHQNLLTIAMSVIGLMAAVICGLLIFIFWRRRMPSVTDATNETNIYETLKPLDAKTKKENKGETDYGNVCFDNMWPSAEGEGEIGYSTFQNNIFCANHDFTQTEQNPYDENGHYDTLP
ncbi:uncharacterized protein LOC132715417 isoform X2 [Ruditapes philippinarum]|uniref:uncharacterized protein LOC132715417 isoform X2 n=1 Tax=Ruditapes philippinarum TaxID=129788 RepID=UPI00295BDB0B|nr:uncharacterized protein LOC132715417 isoform X2 [Ruditapes philippinarum]